MCLHLSFINVKSNLILELLLFFFSNFFQRGFLYQGLHAGNSMVSMGKAGLLGHSLGAYGLPSPGASAMQTGTSAHIASQLQSPVKTSKGLGLHNRLFCNTDGLS